MSTKKMPPATMLGVRLREDREKAGLTPSQAAKRIGIERTYLWKIENDKQTPSARIRRALEALYRSGVTVEAADIREELHEMRQLLERIADAVGAIKREQQPPGPQGAAR